jgi:hypothetical protein
VSIEVDRVVRNLDRVRKILPGFAFVATALR